jgi:hypothetical protein
MKLSSLKGFIILNIICIVTKVRASKKVLIFCLLLLCSLMAISQQLSIAELESCLKLNYEQLDSKLIKKGYSFYSSDKSDSQKKIYSWSFSKTNIKDDFSDYFFTSITPAKSQRFTIVWQLSNGKLYANLKNQLNAQEYTFIKDAKFESGIVLYYINKSKNLLLELHSLRNLNSDNEMVNSYVVRLYENPLPKP